MKRKRRIVLLAALTSVFGVYTAQTYAADKDTVCDVTASAWCIAPRAATGVDMVGGATIPRLATPAWLAAPAPVEPRAVTYNVSTRGHITADMNEFRSVLSETYHDVRGWTRLGVNFREVESGGDFTVYIAEASQMTSFSADVCNTANNCNVGRSVIINQDRWIRGVQPWIKAGGDLAAYRQMAINHETGHWLGHGHTSCGGAGQEAPIMQQQYSSLDGCKPNPWPLGQEMYAPALGIRS